MVYWLTDTLADYYNYIQSRSSNSSRRSKEWSRLKECGNRVFTGSLISLYWIERPESIVYYALSTQELCAHFAVHKGVYIHVHTHIDG